MIIVRRSEKGFTVSGHAGYAPHGQDVVCAAVSTLLQGFLLSVDNLTADELNTDIGAGKALIEYGNLSSSGKLLVDSFFVAVKMVADEFPDYVRVE